MKITETIWSRDVTDIWVLVNFELKIYKDLSSLYVLNCFKYFQVHVLGNLFQKI